MGIRWTEKEANDYGLRKNRKGEWELPQYSSNHSRKMPKFKSGICDETPGPNETQKKRKTKSEICPQFAILVTSFRKRDIDPDNLCPKWYIDEIVRAGYLPDDNSKYVKFITKRVIKVKKTQQEQTVIDVILV